MSGLHSNGTEQKDNFQPDYQTEKEAQQDTINQHENMHTADIDGVSQNDDGVSGIDVVENNMSESEIELDKQNNEEDTSNSETKMLEEENKRLTDELLRTRAEMENSRKRLQRFFEDKVQEKNKALLLDIIQLLDNFERAFNEGSHQENSATQNKSEQNQKAIVEGIKMIEAQFLQTLEKNWKLSRYDSCNKEFDPSLHEAMMKEDSADVEKETVVEEFMKGYMYDQKVLRPAKVKVAIPKNN